MAAITVIGDQVGQVRPTDANPISIAQANSGEILIVHAVQICNTGSGVILIRLFHDKDGTTYDETTALVWDERVLPGRDYSKLISWAGKDPSGNFAVRTDTANDATFTYYGNRHPI